MYGKNCVIYSVAARINVTRQKWGTKMSLPLWWLGFRLDN